MTEGIKKLDIFSKLIRRRLLVQIQAAINKAYAQGRIQFLDGGSIQYEDTKCVTQVLEIDALSLILWNNINDDMFSFGAVGGNLATFNIFPKDIKEIVFKMRR